jgi:hypothetical protein
MSLKFFLSFGAALIIASTANAQIPGFVEKWTVNVEPSELSSLTIKGIGRDGAVLISTYYFGENVGRTYQWVSSTGESIISDIPGSELSPSGFIMDQNYFETVLVSNSNLIIKTFDSTLSEIQISQFNSLTGLEGVTKTKIPSITMAGGQPSDFSCPERLMFILQGSELKCYRPAVDISAPLTSLNINGVSEGSADVLVTSSQGGTLELKGSSDLKTWNSVTNIQTVPGVNKVTVETPTETDYFLKGVSE